jgi:RNA-binding protein YlmH
MNIYQHFRPEEKEYIDQVLNWQDMVERTYTPKLTDFLDPREQHIMKMLIGEHSNLKCEFFGGDKNAERKRAIIMPDYENVTKDDFQISLFEIEYPSKFIRLEHPQVLGTLMSAGLKRGKFGDILLQDKRIQFFVSEDVESYIVGQIQSIGRASVSLVKLGLESAIDSGELWEEDMITVSSLRLDTVLSAIHHLSRQKSQVLIGQGLVKVNWMITERPSFECQTGDLISARGFGRVKILSIDGKTKKDKWRITIGKQK